jgi:putative drug exporter of the RND superfamily
VAWLAVAVLATVIAGAVGRRYSTDYTLPGTESQRASDLLTREFRRQSGDIDTVVFHVTRGTIDSPAVRAVIMPLLPEPEASRTWSRSSIRIRRGVPCRSRAIG